MQQEPYFGEYDTREATEEGENGAAPSEGMQQRKKRPRIVGLTASGETIQLSTVRTHEIELSQGHGGDSITAESSQDSVSSQGPPLQNRKCSTRARKSAPMYLAFVPLVFLILWCMASALVMSTIIGFVLAAVYNTTGFEMSTWVPFLWGCIEASIVVITSWSTFTTIL
ncbi:hypothetical protein QFC19_001909 [Naganishia cerealis]|uniref:Uncharacterized protein n=1 Tax=Naganishia cerealis TaxID=610337 RepID=A0ACC2WDV0_9TREE|nr:hypothetical protein QFC19_001909 [Naganishia cerealis]